MSRVEDWAYDLDDRWSRFRRRGEKPAAHWTIPAPETSPSADSIGATEVDLPRSEPVPVAPADVGPLFDDVAAPGDGVWLSVRNPMHFSAPSVVAKTLIHPDPQRPWAELFIVAIDVRATRLHVVAGTVEPKASTEEGERYVRTGLIPEDGRDTLELAFNGGFKAEHGHYGMKVDGVVLLPPRANACTVARYDDGGLRIGTWSVLSSTEKEMAWWRQTPICMVENGKLHRGLENEKATSWGAALGGETVVRRSAIGLDRERVRLYVGVSNATTARAIALGMQHAGASDVAQLDINWSYPHVVMFEPTDSGVPRGFVLFEGFAYDANTYASRRSQRDFFYVTRAPSAASR